MATPRIFVSSTCYDLQEIRFQLKHFIDEFGYDSVMSEFDDIFYDYNTHVQDSCLKEISKCQLFLLVVGNNYGSFYHQDKHHDKIPESVTLKEFRSALEKRLPKHIFINKWVDYDYKNYTRVLEKDILIYFKENDVPDNKIEDTKNAIKKDFDTKYHFNHDSYKYVFYFLDIIHDLKEGNAINTFESFADIKNSLRKQWAGLMYESLTREDKFIASVIQPLETKIDLIEKSLSKLLETKNIDKEHKITFDLASLSKNTDIESLEKKQSEIDVLLKNIVLGSEYDSYGNYYEAQRVFFNKKFDLEMAKRWLNSLKLIVQNYKWSKFITTEALFKDFQMSKFANLSDGIYYRNILDIYTFYNSLMESEQDSFANTVMDCFNNFVEYTLPTPASVAPHLVDDLPF